MRMQIFRVKKPSGKNLKTKNCVPFEVQYYSKTWQQRASLPFKPAQGHLLQVKISSQMFYGEMTKLFQLP